MQTTISVIELKDIETEFPAGEVETHAQPAGSLEIHDRGYLFKEELA
jgi:hypothetical protein